MVKHSILKTKTKLLWFWFGSGMSLQILMCMGGDWMADLLLGGGTWSENVGSWGCNLKGEAPSWSRPCLSVSWLPWHEQFFSTWVPWSCCFCLQASQLWTETSETVNPNKAFLLQIIDIGYFIPGRRKWMRELLQENKICVRLLVCFMAFLYPCMQDNWIPVDDIQGYLCLAFVLECAVWVTMECPLTYL